MGQKVHPTGMRIGIIKNWTSTWYADTKNYAAYLQADLQVRDYLRKKLSNASVSRIQIERPPNEIKVIIHTARPGIVIGKKGEDIERLSAEVSAMAGNMGAGQRAGDQKAGIGREPGGRERGPADREKNHVQAGHEARCDQFHAVRCFGHQNLRQRTLERRGDRPF